jgi:hypothetical protein
MHQPQKPRNNKPTLSWHQKRLRWTAIKLILVFVLLATAVATAFYYYQRNHFIP